MRKDKAYRAIASCLETNPELGRKKLSEKTGYSTKICRTRKSWWKKDKLESGGSPETKLTGVEDNGEATTFSYQTTERITTKESAVKASGLDLSKWDIQKVKIKYYEMGYKNTNDSGCRLPLASISIEATPKEIDTDAFIEEVTKRMIKHSPKARKMPYPDKDGEYMYELDVFDLHIGKLCWRKEVGENWDTKLAVAEANKAVEDLMGRVENYKLSKILMPVGNDLLHIDNMLNETAHGTHQDVEGRAQKMFMTALMMLVDQIDRLKHIAPVEVPIIPGNHDFVSTFHIGIALYSWFHNDPNVEINIEPRTRKYVRFGKSLIGYCHGGRDDPKMNDLPIVMMTDVPQDFADTIHRHWHIGHIHKSRKKSSMWTEDVFNGIVVKTIRSLTPADAWHYAKGFVNHADRGAEAYLWHKKRGQVANYITYA